MFVYRKAMIEVSHHECIYHFKFRQDQREKPQRVHNSKRISGVRLLKDFLQINPELGAVRRSCGHEWEHLFDSLFSRGAELYAVVRHKVKETQQNIMILHGSWLLQIDQAVDHRKLRAGDTGAPGLKLAEQR